MIDNKPTRHARRARRKAVPAGVLLVLAGFAVAAPPAARAGTALNGTFTVAAGSCSGGVTGSYFRMILHSGSPRGPFLSNSDSTCRDHTYTLLSAGRDGGLVTGSYQEQASPPFDGSGNALTDRITKPTRFYGVNFSTATNRVDPQTRTSVGVPTVTAQGGALSADLRAFAVSWNNQQFNQGSPKPNGSMPGNTRAVTGTYNASTGAYTLQWTSQIQGGPFDGFTGLWHLTGRFVPAHSASSPSPSTQPSATGTEHHTTAPGTATGAPTRGSATSGPSRRHSAGAPLPSPSTSASSAAAPAPTPSVGSTTTRSQMAAATPAGDGGGTRWPWVLVAVLALAVTALGFVRTARRRA